MSFPPTWAGGQAGRPGWFLQALGLGNHLVIHDRECQGSTDICPLG